MEENSTFDSFESIKLTDLALSYLKESAKWCKFLSILGFVGIGLMFIVAIFFAIRMSDMSMSVVPFPNAVLALVYLVLAIVYFFPVYYLYKYANATSKAINSKDSKLLQEGMENLKSHHKFLGVMSLVFISMYALIFIFALIAGSMS
jgi:ABC-type multidrug transport system fused ATPase/permease subunit